MITYRPINGNAGQLKFSLINKNTNETESEVEIYCANFSEEDVDSDFTNEFVNIQDELIKDYYGYRKHIRFSLFNKYMSDTEPNYILYVIHMINSIQMYPELYRLNIKYRDMSTLYDAVFIGNISLSEINNNSNSAQTIEFEFAERKTDMWLRYDDNFMVSYLLLEDGGKILLEDGGYILLENNHIAPPITQT